MFDHGRKVNSQLANFHSSKEYIALFFTKQIFSRFLEEEWGRYLGEVSVVLFFFYYDLLS